MMAITHAAIATAGVSLLLSTSHPLPLALAVLGSQLPDLDTTLEKDEGRGQKDE